MADELCPEVVANYTITRELGRGAFSVVFEGIHKKTGQKYAIKTIFKRYVSQKGWINLSREIEIMGKVDHPNVLKLCEYYESESQIDLVLEYMTGGELFEQIVQRGSFGERDASTIVKQILQGLAYLHSVGVAHRDLKPENLLCSAEDSRVVVADFGLAKIFGRGELLQTHCGTPSYAAPEVVRGDDSYDKSVDLWSVGVITYVLLAGFFPFYDEENEALRDKITTANYEFLSPYWDEVSDEAKDFIRGLLVVVPSKRLTADQALSHPWITGGDISFNNVNLRASMENFQKTQSRRLRDSGY